jgi:hypothetical protein
MAVPFTQRSMGTPTNVREGDGTECDLQLSTKCKQQQIGTVPAILIKNNIHNHEIYDTQQSTVIEMKFLNSGSLRIT